MNNVDLRTGFLLAGRTVPIVVATVREARALAVYRLDTSTRRLVPVGAGRIRIGISAYGLCLYRSPEGRFSAFVNSEHGQVEEWRLLARGGLVEGRRVRRFDVGSRTEGCVVDDASRRLYIAEENQGIWRYDLAGPSRRRLVDATGGSGHLTADVEGLALVRREGGTGYLIASSQGDDTFAVYRREGRNRYLGSFRIHDGAGADEVTGTDGIDATSSPLGPAFPHGLLVAQDGDNDGGNQNFKLVPLEAVIRGGQP